MNKRTSSEPCLNTPQRRRLGHSSDDVSIEVEETPTLPVSQPKEDLRELVQVTLDQICELQRSLDQEMSDCDDDADDSEDDGVELAGFEFCAKEALKFLVEQEQLGPHHPVVRQLTAHLEESKRHLPF